MRCDAAREAAIWELEEQHLKDKAQLARRQLKELYLLKRHQMITRHEKVGICVWCDTSDTSIGNLSDTLQPRYNAHDGSQAKRAL